MRKLGLFSKDTNFNFIKYHKVSFIVSSILVVFFISYSLLKGFNWGVDFKGGLVFVVKTHNSNKMLNKAVVKDIKKHLIDLKITKFNVESFNEAHRYQITISQNLIDKLQSKGSIVPKLRKAFGKQYIFLKSEYVSSSVSKGLISSGVISVILGLVGIFLYVWIRFDWQYGLIGIVALLHDCIIGFGGLALLNYEVSISSVVAVLTIIGYSINDTIITFNQVKENIHRAPKLNDKSLLNKSLNDVISRTIATAATVILVLLSVYLFGGSSLTGFSFVLLVGVIVGTYSSIFLAVPLLLYIGSFRKS